MKSTKFTLDPGWRILLNDFGIESSTVLKKAGVPEDLLTHKEPTLDAENYFKLWNAVVETAGDPILPLKLGQTVSVEAFHPAFFAGLCSPNLNIAMERISKFKRLVGPLVYNIIKTNETTTIQVDCLNIENPLPETLTAFELVFIVYFGRLGTRAEIQPLAVSTTLDIPGLDAYAEYFGIPIQKGTDNSVTFSATDAARPFLTENKNMWSFFEPELRKRLADLQEEENFSVRVNSSLLDLLPSGQATMDAVAKKLSVSKRTLQRRLNDEATTFHAELNRTREKLARHYLTKSELSGAQISFLLGFEEPSSFYRAFQSWTGQTPKQLRNNEFEQKH